MDYDALIRRLRVHAGLGRLRPYGAVRENRRRYPVVRFDTPGRTRVLITAGFHGEEPAGPLTLAEHLPRIVDHARKRGIGLTIFPCINPSGFEAGTRYNAKGERPNNDFLRYRLGDGSVVGELYGRSPPFASFRVFRGGPQETRLLRRELVALPTPTAALDIHQDNYMRREATYAYVFGDATDYAALARRASRHLPLAAQTQVDPKLTTDAHGFLWFHDGSVTDWFMRRGVRFCATLETTTRSDMQKCHRVNLIWIKGFIDRAARVAQRKTG